MGLLQNTLLQQTRVQKTYFALTWGVPGQAEGVIDAPIARRPLPSLLREIRADGKPSITEYWVLAQKGNICKLALRPVTGRTHQLRLHCAHIGFPILGDPQYCTEDSGQISRELGYTHQQLCAGELELIHPITGEALHIQSRMDVNIVEES